MNDAWQIRVFEDHDLVYTVELTGPAELGRQSSPAEKLYGHLLGAGRQRVVIAGIEERSVSRQHALLEPITAGGFRLTNLSAERPITLPDGADLAPKTSCSVAADALLTIGKKAIHLQTGSGPQLMGLSQATLPPGKSRSYPAPFASLSTGLGMAGMDMKSLVAWLQAAADVLQSAASSADFFAKAARAVVDLVKLDSGRVLIRQKEEWQSHGLSTAPGVSAEAIKPVSRYVLDRVYQEKRTFWEVADTSLLAAPSLRGVDAVVAAPILDRNGAVIGALYGDRRQESRSAATGPITELEATLVEVLAGGVAAGLARVEQEKAAMAARVQFEQFFTPELSRHLAQNPDLLKGRDTDVSILFCDIRGFSRISERLGPAQTFEWISDVMEELSVAVRNEGGVLVDYIGDELIAMWGAPEEQPDHARRACRAALEMLARLVNLNVRWAAILQEPTDVGIGINTGLAGVGNTGSKHKFKYGPLGNTVNLASRVQGATKYLKCKVLITGTTQAHLDDDFATRRLCQVRVVNIAGPVALHELVPADKPNWPGAKVEYEKALAEFEAGKAYRAARILGNWLEEHPQDAPPVLLLHRAVQCLVDEPSSFDPVWVLPGK